ncbi:SHOCT domain-containing protein [Euhalothece natronophila Z-M001]|uniref:SHOCT domain-containing protein n=1 Tax=Euhalothece natronophila Z-M001 TaxID=522448 RepID=A0A5B8NK86_9CHRO|nr:SHOCT domain-containing protein [Euhalothece natronophila]QDZ38735.1 SHOCT domain-containing protein [Euhalothece natronophila Z-M001]
MTKHYFIASDQETLSKVYRDVIVWFKEKEYEVDSTQTGDVYLVQAAKTGFLRTIFGTNLAFKVNIYWSSNPTTAREFIIETRVGKWVRNIAGAGFTAMFTGGFTIFTGFAGASWALVLERDLIRHLQENLNLQRVSISPESSSNFEESAASKQTVDVSAYSTARSQAIAEIKEEIDQLKQALQKDIISQEEFEKKKENLEDKIDEREIELLIEEKSNQLQEAFTSGILDADEYEAKLQSIENAVREKLSKKQKLKEARDNGILTEEEYQNKVSQLYQDIK